MRGKRYAQAQELRQGRIIPSRAGQTSACTRRTIGNADHPRACGANHRSPRRHPYSFGSSPRVRGKHAIMFGNMLSFRIIPARAGQTSVRPHGQNPSSDHPCACGANRLSIARSTAHAGSSPRVRGKHLAGGQVYALLRIIPARAGQTMSFGTNVPASTDHPRACGANRHALGLAKPPQRIIPARAGQTMG